MTINRSRRTPLSGPPIPPSPPTPPGTEEDLSQVAEELDEEVEVEGISEFTDIFNQAEQQFLITETAVREQVQKMEIAVKKKSATAKKKILTGKRLNNALKCLKEMKEITQRIFPETSLITPLANGAMVKILFPIINITNSSREKHTIQDIVVRFRFICFNRTTIQLSGSFEGTRLTYTSAEYVSNYWHSHLPQRDHGSSLRWEAFCLGSGPINIEIGELRQKFDAFKYEVFLLCIEPFLSWESIEGRPHFRIHAIGQGNNDIHDTLGMTLLNAVSKAFFTKVSPDKVSVIMHSGKYKDIVEISDPDKLEDYIMTIVKLLYRRNPNNMNVLTCYKDRAGKYYKATSLLSTVRETESLTFNNIEHKVKITDRNDQTQKTYPHPQLTRYIRDIIIRKIEELLRKSNRERPDPEQERGRRVQEVRKRSRQSRTGRTRKQVQVDNTFLRAC